MTDGINPTDLNITPERSDKVTEKVESNPEVQEAAASLEKATLKPEEKVEAEREIQESEDLEAAFTETMRAAPEAGEAAVPAADRGPETGDRVVAEADRGPGTEDGGEVTGGRGDEKTGIEGEPEGGAVTEGEMDPDLVDGGEAENSGAVPGEVSGVAEGDGSAAPAFRGDGETQLTDFSDQISEKESLDQETEVLVQEAPREVATSPAPQERTAPGSDTPAPAQDDMKAAPSSQPIQETPETESISSGEPNANTAKVTGAVTPQGAGLPVDDDSDTSSLPADTEPGVGLDAVSGGLETQEVISTGEQVSESVPPDVNALVQSVLREAYLENTQDLQSYADKVKYFNECKKQVRDYLNQIREQAADIKDNEELTIPITTTEETVDGSSSESTQELNLTLEEAERFIALEVDEDPPGEGDSESVSNPPASPPVSASASELESTDEDQDIDAGMNSVLSSSSAGMEKDQEAAGFDLNQPDEGMVDPMLTAQEAMQDQISLVKAGIDTQGNQIDALEDRLAGEGPEDSIPAGEEIESGGSKELKESLAPLQQDLGALQEMVSDAAGDQNGSLIIESAYSAYQESDWQVEVREESTRLKDELSDWSDDGSTRQITYTDWVQNEDGTYSPVEKTESMTKAEVESLLSDLENQFLSEDDITGDYEPDTETDVDDGSVLPLEGLLDYYASMLANVEQQIRDLGYLLQSDWPVGEERTITTHFPVRGIDGYYVLDTVTETVPRDIGLLRYRQLESRRDFMIDLCSGVQNQIWDNEANQDSSENDEGNGGGSVVTSVVGGG